jgi:hypothetical protein
LNPANTRLRHDHFVRHMRAPLKSLSRHAKPAAVLEAIKAEPPGGRRKGGQP